MASVGERQHSPRPATAGADERIRALLAYGEETGCIELSEVGRLAEECDLPDATVEDLLDQIEAPWDRAQRRLRPRGRRSRSATPTTPSPRSPPTRSSSSSGRSAASTC